MRNFAIPAISIVLLVSWIALSAGPPAQERVKAKGPADFQKTLTVAQEHWEKQRYGKCIAELQAAIGVATDKRAEAILAAFPAAPEGWTVLADKNRAARNNPLAAMMQSSVGTIIEHKYRKDGGGQIDVTMTADSPFAQMFNMTIANPAMLEANSEAITYGAHKAVLKNQRGQLGLQILISGKHMVDITGRQVTEEELFAIWDQAAVDALAVVLDS